MHLVDESNSNWNCPSKVSQDMDRSGHNCNQGNNIQSTKVNLGFHFESWNILDVTSIHLDSASPQYIHYCVIVMSKFVSLFSPSLYYFSVL